MRALLARSFSSLPTDAIKDLVQHFPFLEPRNVFTDQLPEDYNYEYMNGIGELPVGWERLFLLFCKHLRTALVEYNFLDKFRFTQIKEKYGSLCLYNTGTPETLERPVFIQGVPVDSYELILIYEHLSNFVCQECGAPAKFTARGWITQLCAKCFKRYYRKDTVRTYRRAKRLSKPLQKSINFTTTHYFSDGTELKIRHYARPFWREYKKCLRLSDLDFLKYINNK